MRVGLDIQAASEIGERPPQLFRLAPPLLRAQPIPIRPLRPDERDESVRVSVGGRRHAVRRAESRVGRRIHTSRSSDTVAVVHPVAYMRQPNKCNATQCAAQGQTTRTQRQQSASAVSVSTTPRDIGVERIRPFRERAALRAESRRGET